MPHAGSASYSLCKRLTCVFTKDNLCDADKAAFECNTVALHKALDEGYSLHSETPDSLFDAAVHLTGGAADTLLSPKRSKRSSSAEDLGARTKQALTTTALSLIKAVVKLGAPNGDVFASNISEYHGFRELYQPSLYQTQSYLERNLVSAVRFCSEKKTTGTMLQLMSLFPTDASTDDYSERSLAFVVQQSHTAPGITTRFAIAIRILEGSKCCIQLFDRDNGEKRKALLYDTRSKYRENKKCTRGQGCFGRHQNVAINRQRACQCSSGETGPAVITVTVSRCDPGEKTPSDVEANKNARRDCRTNRTPLKRQIISRS
jgi:hypothetical protein